MAQVFSPAQTLLVKVLLLALLTGAITIAVVARWRMAATIGPGDMPAQPIPFSHRHHAGDDRIDCRYCHTSVENAAFAGMPSTMLCLTCHSQLYKDAPVLRPLHESARRGTAIAWTRVNQLPDFVYFNHGIHVSKGVGCVECHGAVDRMPITERVAPLTMQWCLACHRDPAPHLRAPEQVYSMTPTSALGGDPGELARRYHLQSTRRLTDCSTCHR